MPTPSQNTDFKVFGSQTHLRKLQLLLISEKLQGLKFDFIIDNSLLVKLDAIQDELDKLIELL